MSFTSMAAKRSLRIIALPLATPAPRTTPTHKLSEHLTYYHFITSPAPESKAKNWTNWVTSKATDLWAGLGRAPEGNWKRRAFLYGERLIDRLDFEELALKSFDTSLGPKLLPIGRKDKVRPDDHPTISLIYPPSACTSPVPHLRSLLEKRTPRHRKGAILWVAISPLTAPFMLIPIIPNFPFFFCAWRAWSHYQAFKASQYLETFLNQGAIVPQASAELDAIYTEYKPTPPDPGSPEMPRPGSPYESVSTERNIDLDANASATPSSVGPAPMDNIGEKPLAGDTLSRSHLLLTRAAVPALEQLFDIPPGSTFAADVYRALEQARLRLDKEGR